MFNAPDDPKIQSFAFCRDLFQLPVLRELKFLVSLIFIQLAPGIPVGLTKSTTGISGAGVGVASAVATFFFCFVVNAGWTYSLNMFVGCGADQQVMCFADDTANLILYVLVCPLYVGLGVWLWMVVLNQAGELRAYARSISEPDSPREVSWVKGFALLTIILGVSLFGTSNYISDITNTSRVPVDYWFVVRLADGSRAIGPLGVYYFLINFVLLTITLISITLFMSIFVVGFEIGAALDRYRGTDALDFNVLKIKLSAFTEAYLLGKALAFLYMWNILIWQSSPLGNTENLWVAGLFASLIGVFFISLPRYYIELQWFRYRVRAGLLPEDDSEQYQDIRPSHAKFLAMLFDTLIIGGFILSFWKPYIASLTNQ
ncbi:MAG: hypothetical protein AB7Q81_10085 [Gammaproteobacteria bacterium]